MPTLLMTTDALRRFFAETFPQVSDFTVEEVTPEAATLRLHPGPQHLRPGGTVSGPTLFALADLAVYAALLSRIGPVALAVTTSSHIDFMRKPEAGVDLLGRARLVKLGRSLAVGHVEIFSEGLPEPVAMASLTYAIPPKKP